MIVDLTVEHDPNGPVLVAHGLMAQREIHDAEPTKSQSDTGLNMGAVIVRSAMPQPVFHPLQHVGNDGVRRVGSNDSADSAHRALGDYEGIGSASIDAE